MAEQKTFFGKEEAADEEQNIGDVDSGYCYFGRNVSIYLLAETEIIETAKVGEVEQVAKQREGHCDDSYGRERNDFIRLFWSQVHF